MLLYLPGSRLRDTIAEPQLGQWQLRVYLLSILPTIIKSAWFLLRSPSVSFDLGDSPLFRNGSAGGNGDVREERGMQTYTNGEKEGEAQRPKVG